MSTRPVIRPLAALVLALGSLSALPAGDKPRELSVLFLGDRGHHLPADRAAQLTPVMAARGIRITYTEELADLNPDNLARYDALILYANIEKIGPDQEKALLDYVAAGGGFVPIHCASYCFLNAPRYVALVGAQFLRHGTGEFDTHVADPDHPIMRGLEPFRTWDETYVHQRHNDEHRQVLQTRSEGDHEEPWTWVRSEGKGRVFYTAYGHDAQTWGNPGFHALIERGIRWAAGKKDVFDSNARRRSDVAPFQYTKAVLPNYLAGKSWGTQGEPLSRMQLPIAPEESMKHMLVPPGFELRLFAAEPDITKPIAMAWDERGRLWIAETTDYPNEKHPDGQGHDRIKILEDSDGDGRADKFTVFAEGLSIPTSLAFANGGVVVTQPPDTLFLKDTDGDDQADVRQVLFSGWSTSDTHAGPSNLRWGFDNWIWGIVGYAGFRGRIGDEPQEFRTGFYRFKPDGSKLEFLRNTNNNSWGVGFSEDGIVFGSTANGNPSVYLPIPNRYYEAVRGWSPTVLGNTAASARFYPVTDKVRQVDYHGSFTAGAGHALYTARSYPDYYWNRTAFVSEPTGHLTATFVLDRRGSDFVSYNSWNLLASDDEWTAPIVAEVGPDGQVWVIDWYNYIVQHNPTPQGFKTGKGAAYETPLRDKTHGRIYRVVYKDAKPYQPIRLDASNADELVETLKDDNMFWRTTAQRLLVERGERDVLPSLARLAQDSTVDALGLNPAAIHALWTMHGLGALDGSDPAATGVAVTALGHPSAGVRRAALQVLPRDDATTAAILAAAALADRDAQVRLAAFLALAEVPASDRAAAAILSALDSPANTRDRWIPDAATSAAARHDDAFLRALAGRKSETPADAKLLEIAARVAQHYARGGPADSVGVLLAALAGSERPVADTVVQGLADGWPKGRPARLDPAIEQAMIRLLDRLSPAAKAQLVSLAVRWGSQRFEAYTAEIAASFLARATDPKENDAARAAAALQLIDFRKTDTAAALDLLKLITPRTSPQLAAGLIEAVSHSESPDVASALVEHLPAMTPGARAQSVHALLGRARWTEAFMDGVEQGKVQLSELSLDQKRALAEHPNAPIARRAKTLLERGGGLPDPDRQKVIDELAPLVLRSGDATQGKEVFKQQCIKCHMHNGEGNKVGPDLTGMAAHTKQELMIHILDPSRSVEGNFRQYVVALDDGRVLNGLLASETKTSIEIIDAEGKKHAVLRENIDELVTSAKSLMPEGFEKQVSPQAIADLLEFLTQRGKYLPLDLHKVASAVSTQGMFYNKDSSVERLVFPDWSPKTFEDVPFQLVDPEGDRVPNVVLLYGPQGTLPPGMPKSVTLPCNCAARAIHLLSGVSGWGYNGGNAPPTVSMIVRLHYADGGTEDHPLKNGVHFADYIRRVDVPDSKLAFMLRGQQIRYLAIQPERPDLIETIELVKGPDRTAPVVMAVTVETRE